MTVAAIARVLDAAAGQHGVVTRAQAHEIGVDDSALYRLRRDGVLTRRYAGVFVLGPGGWLQDVCAATLASNGRPLVSHRAAGRLLEIEGFDASEPELSVDHPRSPQLRGVVLHRSTDLAGERRVRRNGLWLTNPTRTLVDLGAVVPEAQLEVALDDALRRGLTTQDRLWTAIARLGRPGRSGVPQLRRLLEARGDVDGLTETGFETLLLRALREHGLPRPSTQHALYDDEGVFVMRFDAAYVDRKVGIEADSKRWHGTDQRFEDDREKRARAEALGWHVLPFTYRQVTRRPGWVAGTVDRALGSSRPRVA